jgi:hypothetical protein
MSDVAKDAKEWLAEQPQRTQTHSENCHKWHASCLVSRLLAEVERLREEKSADWKAACEAARIASEEIAALRAMRVVR